MGSVGPPVQLVHCGCQIGVNARRQHLVQDARQRVAENLAYARMTRKIGLRTHAGLTIDNSTGHWCIADRSLPGVHVGALRVAEGIALSRYLREPVTVPRTEGTTGRIPVSWQARLTEIIAVAGFARGT